MTPGFGDLDLSIDRLVLDGLALPADAVATLPGLVEAELRRIFDGGAPSPEGRNELQPLVLSTPPDVAGLARAIASRVADRAAAEGAWDG